MLTKSPIVTGNLLSEDEEGNIPTMPDDPETIFLDGRVIEKQPFESIKQKKTIANLQCSFFNGTNITP